MSSLAAEIAETESRIAAIDQGFEERVRTAHAELTSRVLTFALEADKAKAGLRLRLSHLRAAADGSETITDCSTSEQTDVEPVRHPRPTARELILRALRDRGPLSSNVLDTVVISDGGWTKAAADKAKLLSKRDGLTTSAKRIWSITPKGLEEVSKFGP